MILRQSSTICKGYTLPVDKLAREVDNSCCSASSNFAFEEIVVTLNSLKSMGIKLRMAYNT